MEKALCYTVTATFRDQAQRDQYVAWLGSGHMQEVLRGGALRAEIVVISDPALPIRVEARYVFADSAGFEAYVRDHAPRLRAEGLARFGPETGIAFSRALGDIHEIVG